MLQKPEESKPIKVQAADVISGSLYLKLLADYQAYDKQQKDYILSLENRISELTQVLEDTRSGSTKKIYEKLERQRKKIHMLQMTTKRLKVENDNLIRKIALLNLKIKEGNHE